MSTTTCTEHRPLASESTHEHAWLTESAHEISDGRLTYVRCAECGTRRVDLLPRDGMPPRALSRVSALEYAE